MGGGSPTRKARESRSTTLPFASGFHGLMNHLDQTYERHAIRGIGTSFASPWIEIEFCPKDLNMDTRQRQREEHREAKFEAEAMSARHRPDERPPNDAPMPPGSGAGDRHAAGATGGGSAVGGLAGTNTGDGSPENADIDAAAGSGDFDHRLDEQDPEFYSGRSGGAVGGTPAGKRVRGGRMGRGLTPGGIHRGDSTIGGEPHQSGEAPK